MAACTTCGGWVAPVEALHTDQGIYHDWPSKCLSEEEYERLVAKWSCECGQEYRDHLEEEHRSDPVWSTEELAARERRFMDARLP